MFNIADFSTHVKKFGTLQTNKYMVRLSPPQMFGPLDIDRLYEYRANAVRIPGVNLDMQNVNRYGLGPQQKFPTNVNFTDVDITFVDMQKNELWKHFTKWVNGIFDYTGRAGGDKATYNVEYKKYYETTVDIFVYDNDANLVNVIVLKEAFPNSINDVSLSWGENNRLYEFTVRFTFKEWYYMGYNVGRSFDSGAVLGPGATSQVLPQRTESPRPLQTAPRADPFGLGATPDNETGTQGPANFGSFNF
jgi:hypothetical protein